MINEKLLNETIEVFVGSGVVVFGINLMDIASIEKTIVGSIFTLIGIYYILKANRSYKRRKNHAK